MTDDAKKLAELIDDIPIGMLTTFGPDGPRSIPMARQEVEPSAELWFISARDTAHTRAIQQEPRVSLTFSARDSWVAAYGRAEVVDDTEKLRRAVEHLRRGLAARRARTTRTRPCSGSTSRAGSTGTPRAGRSPRC